MKPRLNLTAIRIRAGGRAETSLSNTDFTGFARRNNQAKSDFNVLHVILVSYPGSL
jgi:hypothetical protein